MTTLFGLARMTVSSSGTGNITLNSAVSGFLTFDLAGCSTAATGQIVSYAINDTTNSELGLGTYYSSGPTLVRGSTTSVNLLQSTNSNSPINMSTSAQILVTPRPIDMAPIDSPSFTTQITVTGTANISSNVLIGGTLGLTGNFAINTNKFTVTAASGNTLVAGTLNVTGATTLSAALTYGGVALSNAVTGTGNMVLSASPTLTGTLAAAAGTFSSTLGITGALTYGGVTLSTAVTGTGNMALSANTTFTGTTTIATLALTTVGAHTISGAITYGGVALSNAVTGTGSMALSASPTFTGTVTAALVTTSNKITVSSSDTNLHAAMNVQAAVSNADIAYFKNTTAAGDGQVITAELAVLGTAANAVFIGADTGGNRCVIYGNGNIQNFNNSYGALSDASFKFDVSDMPSMLGKIMRIRPRTYRMIGDDEKAPLREGIVAQEIEEEFPHLVSYDTNGVRSFNYMGLVVPMAKALQELAARVP